MAVVHMGSSSVVSETNYFLGVFTDSGSYNHSNSTSTWISEGVMKTSHLGLNVSRSLPVVAIPGCHLDYIWNELQSRIGRLL